MSYYGAGQDQLYDFVLKSHMLPCEKVLWTALEGKGEEEGTRAPIYGPAIIGRKSTGKAPQWFGNCVHIEQLVTQEMDEKNKQMRVIERPVMYLRTHAEAVSKIPFPCGTRAPFQFASELPEYLDPPDMGKLYTLLDGLTEKMDAEVRKLKAEGGDLPQTAPAMIVVPQLVIGDDPIKVEPVVAVEQLIKEPVKPPIPMGAMQSQATFIPPRISVKKPV